MQSPDESVLSIVEQKAEDDDHCDMSNVPITILSPWFVVVGLNDKDLRKLSAKDFA